MKTKAEIMELAKNVSYDELQPWFNTAAKKVGTRIATMITLNVLLSKGLARNEEVEAFIKSGQEDNNELLQKEANSI